jgi:hypothetical protein
VNHRLKAYTAPSGECLSSVSSRRSGYSARNASFEPRARSTWRSPRAFLVMFSIPPTRLKRNTLLTAPLNSSRFAYLLCIRLGRNDSRRSRCIKQKQDKINSNVNATGDTVVVARRGNQDPLHLDRGRTLAPSEDWKNRSAAVLRHFVDLYLLSSSRLCCVWCRGYGQLASLLSYNRSCSINHRTTNCTWTTAGDIWSPAESYLVVCQLSLLSRTYTRRATQHVDASIMRILNERASSSA